VKHSLRAIGSLGNIRALPVSGLACLFAGLRRLRFSFFSDEPTLSKVVGASIARRP
jgi:hypothetical protein